MGKGLGAATFIYRTLLVPPPCLSLDARAEPHSNLLARGGRRGILIGLRVERAYGPVMTYRPRLSGELLQALKSLRCLSAAMPERQATDATHKGTRRYRSILGLWQIDAFFFLVLWITACTSYGFRVYDEGDTALLWCIVGVELSIMDSSSKSLSRDNVVDGYVVML